MNLGEFLNTHKKCPICNYGSLTITFISSRKQIIRYEDDNLVVMMDLRSLKATGTDYKVGYYFSLKDNSFRIEFFNKYGEKFYDKVNVSLLDNFKEFSKNNKILSFQLKCSSCHKFGSSTKGFSLNYKECTTSNIELFWETFGFVIKTNEDYKVIVMNNYHDSQESKIFYWRQNDGSIRYNYDYPESCSRLSLPLIPFISELETKNRLNTLLLFS